MGRGSNSKRILILTLQSYLDNDFHQGRSIDSFIKKYEQVSTYDCHHNVSNTNLS